MAGLRNINNGERAIGVKDEEEKTINYYNPQTAVRLAKVCQLGYEQYARGIEDPNYDGAITPPKGYCQIAAFTAPDLSLTDRKTPEQLKKVLDLRELRQIDLTNLDILEHLVEGVKKVYFGFALAAADGSGNGIIAFRGTQALFEWLMDATFIQVPLPIVWFTGAKLKLTNAHFGFLFLYAFLVRQIIEAVSRMQQLQTCYVTGHSLGAALAVLAALTLGTVCFPLGGVTGRVQMYNFAGPRVGDPSFVAAYNHFVPHSFRVTNLADSVAIIPPENIFDYQYRHIGTAQAEWSFLNQSGDVAGNHSLDTYLDALARPGAVTNALRHYPCPGF
jgi:triacylglycerol lipase